MVEGVLPRPRAEAHAFGVVKSESLVFYLASWVEIALQV